MNFVKKKTSKGLAYVFDSMEMASILLIQKV